MNRFVCIHGHFYQPPRENPWLEEIEIQESAFPYHDWNERITDECYGPNATARILMDDGWIDRIVNNYSKISFNFGPTLLSWLQESEPAIYQAIVDADRESQQRFSGHGSALAQVYNHMILPLAAPRDMHTQVLWGMRDFESRFNRAPEGMWLPETAVNIATLELLAEHGIKFTILSPYQARRSRKLGGRKWSDARGGKINPRMPYRHGLPSGRHVNVFFYDGPISQGVAFEGLLSRGESFAKRLMDAFEKADEGPQLAHIATDGETYGHHHRHGDMALAYALHYIEENDLATLTNYGEYLERFPPTHEVQIIENTAWSCAHGVDRWRKDCGCHSGQNPDWNQKWREPLRDALDWLRDELAPKFEEHSAQYLADPWRARDDYIEVILDRSPESREKFLRRHATKILNEDELIRLAKLLEMQRYAMLMYTSCGWFFDDLSGIETVQVISYAGRALQLAQELFGDHIETLFLDRLAKANSNVSDHGDGRNIYQKFVRPAFVDLHRVGAHYVISLLFEAEDLSRGIHCYKVDVLDHHHFETGRNSMIIGQAAFQSDITLEKATLVFGAVYFGHHTVHAGIRTFISDERYNELKEAVVSTFEMADYPKIIRTFDQQFGDVSYSLFSVFRDQQQAILERILGATLVDIEGQLQHLYEENAPLLRFLNELGARVPASMHMTAQFIVNAKLRHLLESNDLNPERVRHVLHEARDTGISLHHDELQHIFQNVMERKAETLEESPRDADALAELLTVAVVYNDLPFNVNVRRVQNTVYDLIDEPYRDMAAHADSDEKAKAWAETFRSVAELLKIRIREG